MQDYPLGMRLDRGFFTQPTWLGLICTAIYVLLNPEVIPAFTETTGNVIGAILGFGALVCLGASLLHNWRLAFQLELIGSALIIAAMIILDFTAPLTLFQQMTLVGGLGVWVQISSIRLMAHLIRALRVEQRAA